MQLKFKGDIEESFIQIHSSGLQSHELKVKLETDCMVHDISSDINKPCETRKGDEKFSQNSKKTYQNV